METSSLDDIWHHYRLTSSFSCGKKHGTPGFQVLCMSYLWWKSELLPSDKADNQQSIDLCAESPCAQNVSEKEKNEEEEAGWDKVNKKPHIDVGKKCHKSNTVKMPKKHTLPPDTCILWRSSASSVLKCSTISSACWSSAEVWLQISVGLRVVTVVIDFFWRLSGEMTWWRGWYLQMIGTWRLVPGRELLH